MREVMDAFCDSTVDDIVGMFSAQMAKTTVIENAIAYHAHHDPAPIMWVEPTLDIAESMSKDRLAPMIADTPVLKERFSSAGSKSSGDTLLHKKFPGGHVTLAGANSYNSLASRPIRIVIGDEVAKWQPNEKGSPVRQVRARIRAFWHGKAAWFSTPTDESPDNEFHQLWQQSDKRLYFISCPHCYERVVMTFDETPECLPSEAEVSRAVMKWRESDPIRTDGRAIRRAAVAWFECLKCGGHIDDNERHRAVRGGEWRATQEFAGVAGFWGWTAMSPFVSALFIANEWLGALGSPKSLQSVKNETLGLPWVEQGSAPDWKRLFDRRDLTYNLGEIPAGVLFLTAGADVQADRLEVSVWGWGRGKQCWLVDYYGIAASNALMGDPSRPEVWQQLTQILGTVYRHPNGLDLTIKKFCIDSGYMASKVEDWVRQHKFGPVAMVKGGSDSQAAPIGAPTFVEKTVGGKRLQSGVRLHMLNTKYFKDDLYGRLSLELPNTQKGETFADGFVHFPELPDMEEFCRQLTAETLIRGKYVRQRANEALDMWDYARAGAMMLGMDRMQSPAWEALEAQLGSTPAIVAPPSREVQTAAVVQQERRHQSGNWFSGVRGKGSWLNR